MPPACVLLRDGGRDVRVGSVVNGVCLTCVQWCVVCMEFVWSAVMRVRVVRARWCEVCGESVASVVCVCVCTCACVSANVASSEVYVRVGMRCEAIHACVAGGPLKILRRFLSQSVAAVAATAPAADVGAVAAGVGCGGAAPNVFLRGVCPAAPIRVRDSLVVASVGCHVSRVGCHVSFHQRALN